MCLLALTLSLSRWERGFLEVPLTVVRYDNETGKGDHRHYGGREEPYRFVDEATLYADFMADVERKRKRRK